MENIIASLQTAWTDAQYQLAHPTIEEEPNIEEPSSFYGKIQKQLKFAIQKAFESAKDFKVKEPTAHLYVHYEAFPEKLYKELLQAPSLKEGLENIGFNFYVTHNGDLPHPMVKLILHF